MISQRQHGSRIGRMAAIVCSALVLFATAPHAYSAEKMDGAGDVLAIQSEKLDRVPEGSAAARLPDGSVFIAGGVGANGQLLSAVERVHPDSDAKTVVKGLELFPRRDHRVVTLLDGNVLVMGGQSRKGRSVSAIELIDVPSFSLISKIDAEMVVSPDAIASILDNGHILVAHKTKGAFALDPVTGSTVTVNDSQVTDILTAWDGDQSPEIVSTVPPSNALEVPVNRPIGVLFSKHMNGRTLSDLSVALIGPHGHVSHRLTVLEKGRLLFVVPRQELTPYSTYTLVINGAEDLKGNRLALASLLFSTGSAQDKNEPGSESGKLMEDGGADASSSTESLSAQKKGSRILDALQGVVASVAGRAIGSNEESVEESNSASISKLEVIDMDDEFWIPGRENYQGAGWRSGRTFEHSHDFKKQVSEQDELIKRLPERSRQFMRTKWREAGMLKEFSSKNIRAQTASAQVEPSIQGNAVTGQVLRLNGKPLANVTLKIGSRSTVTDGVGNFVLDDVPEGEQVLVIDGTTANKANRVYGRFDYRLLVNKGINALDFTLWMPRLDMANAVSLVSPTVRDVVVTNPKLPGLELRIPAGTVIRDAEGKIVRKVSITPLPADQLPFPMPYADVPLFYTIQPGGAILQSTRGTPQGAQLVYPNYTTQPPGAPVPLFDYDPYGRGWYEYAVGRISNDGARVETDAPFTIYQFTASSSAYSANVPPADGPVPCEGGDYDGDPVSCFTGLFVETGTDLSLNDVVPISLNRVYRHNDNVQRDFGVGTTHSYGAYLHIVSTAGFSADEISLVLPTGARVKFLPIGPKNYTLPGSIFESSQPGPFYKAQITLITGDSFKGDFQLRKRDGSRLGFGYWGGAIKWAKDRFGNHTSYVYEGPGLAYVVSPNGRYLHFKYDNSGCHSCVKAVTDNLGREVQYKYDTQGRLVKVIDAEGGVTDYTYDSAHRMRNVRDPVGQTTGRFKVQNEYDATGRIYRQTYADDTTNVFEYVLGSNGKAVETRVTHGRGDVRRITYNADGYILTDTQAYGTSVQQTRTFVRRADNLIERDTDSRGRVTRYEYDAVGNVTSLTRMYGTSNATTWRYTYEPQYSQVLTITDPLQRKRTNHYDDRGLLTHVEDDLGNTQRYVFNSDGQVASVTQIARGRPLTASFTYQQGDLAAITDQLNRTTNFFSDGIGRVVTVVDPLGDFSHTEYDRLSRVAAQIDGQGNRVEFDYDGNGNLLTFTDAGQKITRFSYDPINRLLGTEDALGQIESRVYDTNGNLSFATDRAGRITGFTYDVLDRLSTIGFGATSIASPVYSSKLTYSYDNANRVTKIVDSRNGTISRTYDDRFDTMLKETTPQGSVTYTYYANGLRQSLTPSSGGSKISYTYDAANRLQTLTQAAGTGSALPASAQTVTYQFDEANRPLSLSLPNGMRMEYDLDDAGQLRGIAYRRADGSLMGDLAYTHDDAGLRTGVTGSFARTGLPNASSGNQHDANNRLVNHNGSTITYDKNGNVLTAGGLTYVWNDRQQLITIKRGTTTVASFAYDGVGRRRGKTISGVSTSYLHDGNNPIQERRGTTVLANNLTGFGMDEFLVRYTGSQQLNFLRDGLGSTVRLTDASQNSLVDYTYDPYGGTTASASVENPYQYTGRENDGNGLYYYRARYYSPAWGRFISEDPIGLAGGPNAYAYVDGNPISKTDPSGLCPLCPVVLYLPQINAAGILVAEAIAGVSIASGGAMAVRTIAQEMGIVRIFGKWPAAKKALGSTLENPIHHIVEQCQAQRSGFSLTQINSTDNLIRLDKATHDAISAYYSTSVPGTGGVVRDSLNGKSFQEQFNFGMDVINRALNGSL